jgi:hypothetical protein
MSKIDLYKGDCLNNKQTRLMLHALGIEYRDHTKVIPNKRYSPYPTSHRNYYQTSNCEDWNILVKLGFATYRKGRESWQDCYFVSLQGKEYLKATGYKWHEL